MGKDRPFTLFERAIGRAGGPTNHRLTRLCLDQNRRRHEAGDGQGAARGQTTLTTLWDLAFPSEPPCEGQR